jgi:hypothetical protein
LSIRRRKVRTRVERCELMAKQRAESERSLATMQAVVDELRAEGVKTLDPREFWRRYHKRMTTAAA